MKVIIAGSRTINGYVAYVANAVENCDFTITEVVSGTAKGVDKAGEEWAKRHNIPVKQFPANWEGYGKRAGHIRNYDMAVYADALIAIWDGKSKGTFNMIKNMVEVGKPVFVYCP